MRRRRLSAFALLVVLAFALSGCTQFVRGAIGLTASHGHIYALVENCPDLTSDEVEMVPSAGQFILIPHPSWHFTRGRSASIDLGTTRHFLLLMGDKAQGIQANSSDGVGGYIRFSAADLKALAGGEVLASTGTTADYQVVKAADFPGLLDDLCMTASGR